jgi:hypothetical protein
MDDPTGSPPDQTADDQAVDDQAADDQAADVGEETEFATVASGPTVEAASSSPLSPA